MLRGDTVAVRNLFILRGAQITRDSDPLLSALVTEIREASLAGPAL